jgi:hypothetical protein
VIPQKQLFVQGDREAPLRHRDYSIPARNPINAAYVRFSPANVGVRVVSRRAPVLSFFTFATGTGKQNAPVLV